MITLCPKLQTNHRLLHFASHLQNWSWDIINFHGNLGHPASMYGYGSRSFYAGNDTTPQYLPHANLWLLGSIPVPRCFPYSLLVSFFMGQSHRAIMRLSRQSVIPRKVLFWWAAIITMSQNRCSQVSQTGPLIHMDITDPKNLLWINHYKWNVPCIHS